MGRSTFKDKLTSSKPKADGFPEGLAQMFTQVDDSSRIISLYGDVSEQIMQQIVMQMIHFAEASNAPINMILSTYGGSVDEMFSLYDLIKYIAPPVHTIGMGKVMSAGTLLLAAGEKGKRLIGRSARVMIHPVAGGAEGDIFDVENNVKEMRRLQDLMVGFLSDETKMSRKQVEDIMNQGTEHYLTADEAVKLGIADKVMSPRQSM